MVFVYILFIAAAGALSYLAAYFESVLGMAARIIVISLWAVTAVFLIVLFPLYYNHARITVSDREITKYTLFFTYKYQYMSMESVQSVTTIVLPFGGITGVNCIIINALGARMLLPCLNKKDCMEITKFFNDIISDRSKS